MQSDQRARPKSYLNAVEGVDSQSSAPSDDNDDNGADGGGVGGRRGGGGGGSSGRDPQRGASSVSGSGGLGSSASTSATNNSPAKRHHHSLDPLLGSLRAFPADLAASLPTFSSSSSTFCPSWSPSPSSESGSRLPLRSSTSPQPTSRRGDREQDPVRPADIYAQPRKKKGRPLPLPPRLVGDGGESGGTRVGGRQSSPTLPLSLQGAEEDDSGRSAFHKVSATARTPAPPPPPPYVNAPCDTDLDDLEPLPSSTRSQRRRTSSSSRTAPPYSSPPSYECLVAVGSRHGSVHSLASTSSARTAPEEPDVADLYKQIRKGGSAGSPGSRGGVGGSAQQLNSGHAYHNGNGVGLGAAICNGRPHYDSGPYPYPYPAAGKGKYGYSPGVEPSHPGVVHSFPFRKHHPPPPPPAALLFLLARPLPPPSPPPTPPPPPLPTPSKPTPSLSNPTPTCPTPIPTRTARAPWSRDRLSRGPTRTSTTSSTPLRATLDPAPRGQRSCQGHPGGSSSAARFDMNSNRMSYEDILHLASGLEDSDSEEFMETVI